MKLYTKAELISLIREVSAAGWHKSVKRTKDSRNDGAVGNTLDFDYCLIGSKVNFVSYLTKLKLIFAIPILRVG